MSDKTNKPLPIRYTTSDLIEQLSQACHRVVDCTRAPAREDPNLDSHLERVKELRDELVARMNRVLTTREVRSVRHPHLRITSRANAELVENLMRNISDAYSFSISPDCAAKNLELAMRLSANEADYRAEALRRATPELHPKTPRGTLVSWLRVFKPELAHA